MYFSGLVCNRTSKKVKNLLFKKTRPASHSKSAHTHTPAQKQTTESIKFIKDDQKEDCKLFNLKKLWATFPRDFGSL